MGETRHFCKRNESVSNEANQGICGERYLPGPQEPCSQAHDRASSFQRELMCGMLPRLPEGKAEVVPVGPATVFVD